MKLSVLDSRPLANKGVDCPIYDPRTGAPTKAGITMLGADSDVAKNKWKEINERHRLDGKPVSPQQMDDDAKEVLVACATGWHDVDDEGTGKALAFSADNLRAALSIPEIYKQIATFHATRTNFLGNASAT